MSQKVSLKDIAERVGVSTALVSYVINGKEKEKRVGKEVVKKIREVARELNYQPNQIARSLRKGSTKTIGLIVADIANPFFGNLARVIEDEANQLGYTVIFGSSDENAVKFGSLVNTLVNRQVDGFIVVPTEGSENQISALIEKKIPLVLTDRYFQNIASNYVVLNNFEATYDATAHLIRNGYPKIGMIAYKTDLIHMRERVRGYTEAMNAHHLGENVRIAEVRYSHQRSDTEEAVNTLLASFEKNKALLFATNALTISGLYALTKLPVKIPEELAITGFDGNEAFDFFHTPLTFIRQPIEDIGKEAVRILVGQINGSDTIGQVLLKPTLVERQSSMPANKILQ